MASHEPVPAGRCLSQMRSGLRLTIAPAASSGNRSGGAVRGPGACRPCYRRHRYPRVRPLGGGRVCGPLIGYDRGRQRIPALLQCRGRVAMGTETIRRSSCGTGECAYIPTGGVLPEGADAVVMVEYTEEAGDTILDQKTRFPWRKCPAAGRGFQKRGDRFQPGPAAHPAGCRGARGLRLCNGHGCKKTRCRDHLDRQRTGAGHRDTRAGAGPGRQRLDACGMAFGIRVHATTLRDRKGRTRGLRIGHRPSTSRMRRCPPLGRQFQGRPGHDCGGDCGEGGSPHPRDRDRARASPRSSAGLQKNRSSACPATRPRHLSSSSRSSARSSMPCSA